MSLKKKIKLLDPNMTRIAVPWILRHPSYILQVRKLVKSFKNSVDLRKKALKEDTKVPPFLILSITKMCNLHCAGCYAAAAGTLSIKKENQLNIEAWREIIKEGKELGVFCYVIAGGEPFMFPNLLDLCSEFDDRGFLIFTNGTALKEADFQKLKKLKNVAIMVSIEGGKEQTDKRRGTGVYDKVMATINRLNKIGIINGISVTIDATNYKIWMDEETIDNLIKIGIRVGFFLEYIPIRHDITENIMLTEEERKRFRAQILNYRENKKIYLIHSPGDEEYMGGCVSAGRGFAHITPAGDLTPCPVSSMTTHNLTKSSLREGLSSDFFKYIRENEHLLETEGSPCALFSHQEELGIIAGKFKAKKAGIL